MCTGFIRPRQLKKGKKTFSYGYCTQELFYSLFYGITQCSIWSLRGWSPLVEDDPSHWWPKILVWGVDFHNILVICHTSIRVYWETKCCGIPRPHWGSLQRSQTSKIVGRGVADPPQEPHQSPLLALRTSNFGRLIRLPLFFNKSNSGYTLSLYNYRGFLDTGLSCTSSYATSQCSRPFW